MEYNIMQELIQWKDMGADRMPLFLYYVSPFLKLHIKFL